MTLHYRVIIVAMGKQAGGQGVTREKVVLDLSPEGSATAETVWAISLAEDRYRLDNVPIWAYGLAYCDIVETELGSDGRRHFRSVLHKSGLLTVRAAGPEADRAVFEELCNMLQRNAVAMQRYSASYIACAMEPEKFAQLEPDVNRAEAAGNIFVEIANEE